MNINSFVKVKLTEKGFEIYKNYIDKVNELNLKSINKFKGVAMVHTFDYNYLKDKDGRYSIQLWQLMMIFGEHITPCSSPFFENNEIEIIEEN